MNRVSKLLTESAERGHARAMLYALKLNRQQIFQPHIGIGSMWYESNPCNSHLLEKTQFVKKSLQKEYMNGFIFNTVGVSDGQTQDTKGSLLSLPSRELIKDSIELITNAHYYDGLICIPGCDKNVPASLMAMCEIDRPGFIISGGSISPGYFNGKTLDITSSFEAYGQLCNNKISENYFENINKNCCNVSGGGCGGMFTFNTMTSLVEIMGMSLPNSSTIPSILKKDECFKAGTTMTNLLKLNLKPSDIIEKESFINAIKLLNILGGSTNAVIHLLAIAKSANIDLTLQDFIDHQDIPVLANLKPHGEFLMNDLYSHNIHMSGIINYLIKENIINGDCMTITGKTLKENYCNKKNNINNNIIYPIKRPFKKTSHIRILKGNLAPDGCVSKIYSEKQIYIGKVIVFDTEKDMIDSLKNHLIKKHHFVIIRYQGESTGCPEMLRPTSALIGYFGNNKAPPLATDGRFSGGSKGILVAHLPDAYKKNITTILQNGDKIIINTKYNSININISKEEYNNRIKNIKIKIFNPKGYLKKYSKLVGNLDNGFST